MSLFIESIKIESGDIKNPGYHLRRFNFTRQSFFPEAPIISLAEWIKIPSDCTSGLCKCRVTYGEEIENIEYEKYVAPVIRSLKLVIDDDIEYSFKYKNRFQIADLQRQKEDCDDIMIIKNGRVTDSSFSNLVFLSQGIWKTPKYPLLKKTKREKLLDESLILESDIKIGEIRKFEKAGLINAMVELNEIVIDIQNIH